MGNTASTGHVLAGAATGLMGFERSMQEFLSLHHIQPWSTKELLQGSLEKQFVLAQVSPLRYIPVSAGLRHYRQYLGTWTSSLTRETFVQASLELFHMNGTRCTLEESKSLYDVFDSIDLYQDAVLSVGEFCGGLCNFFAGDVHERTAAIFEVLSGGAHGLLAQDSLRIFLQPYVWCMVPSCAQVLRPLLLDHVTNELFIDIAGSAYPQISLPQMQHWMRNAYRASVQPDAHMRGAVLCPKENIAKVIVNEVGKLIEIAARRAWSHHEESEEAMQLRAYGRQSWTEKHSQQQQLFMDVGAEQWVSQKLRGWPHPFDNTLSPPSPQSPNLTEPHPYTPSKKVRFSNIVSAASHEPSCWLADDQTGQFESPRKLSPRRSGYPHHLNNMSMPPTLLTSGPQHSFARCQSFSPEGLSNDEFEHITDQLMMSQTRGGGRKT
jgi:hypothetical protein